MKQFHYIITGAGCAGLSLLVRLLQSGKFSDKKIVLIDKSPKQGNDRTWCFWEKGDGFFEPIVYRRWQQLWFYGREYTGCHNIAPYQYKMIRGEDFYAYCLAYIKKFPNVSLEYGTIDPHTFQRQGDKSVVTCNGELYAADYIFNSIGFGKPRLRNDQYYLLQHFKGWVIDTPAPVFQPGEATLMDFRVDQFHGTTFVYVMPFSATRALVEYTLFSEELLPGEAYTEALQRYIKNVLNIPEYTIREEEFGSIPMTDYIFPLYSTGAVNIGAAGGQTKASTGYTFQFIQKQTQAIVNNLVQGLPALASLPSSSRRFRWYDSTLLNILSRKKLSGSFIFTELFKKNKATDILQFLDNETRFLQEMKIITVLPRGTFIRAAMQELGKYY